MFDRLKFCAIKAKMTLKYMLYRKLVSLSSSLLINFSEFSQTDSSKEEFK